MLRSLCGDAPVCRRMLNIARARYCCCCCRCCCRCCCYCCCCCCIVVVAVACILWLLLCCWPSKSYMCLWQRPYRTLWAFHFAARALTCSMNSMACSRFALNVTTAKPYPVPTTRLGNVIRQCGLNGLDAQDCTDQSEHVDYKGGTLALTALHGVNGLRARARSHCVNNTYKTNGTSTSEKHRH